jgi:4,5-DOPA dioxygenase extradiol
MINSLFLCHGGPSIVLDNNEYTTFLKEIGDKIKPKAIVIFTAHWESEITTISSISGKYNMIYDFYGFPAELYAMNYPAVGSPEVALKVKRLLEASGIQSSLDNTRGIDHGTWDMLYIMYPKADIPVVQVSVNPFMPMEEQYSIGEALRSLGEEDILVIGSGSTVHNLRTVDWDAKEPKTWAMEFDDWLIEKVESKQIDQLYSYQKLAPNVKLAVPREEHIVPLFIAMGSGQKKQPKLLHRSYAYGTLSYLCFEC